MFESTASNRLIVRVSKYANVACHRDKKVNSPEYQHQDVKVKRKVVSAPF